MFGSVEGKTGGVDVRRGRFECRFKGKFNASLKTS